MTFTRPRIVHAFVGNHHFLSNFHDAPVIYMGLTFPRVENAYQSAKAVKGSVCRKFLTLSAADAKTYGGVIARRPNWSVKRIEVMRTLVRRKFQNPDMAEQLLATGDAVLIEGNHWHDNFWGACTCQRCLHTDKENTLGFLLMERRSLLQRKLTRKGS